MALPVPAKSWPGEAGQGYGKDRKRAGLVGRREEVERALEHLRGEGGRVVHVWGDPGVVSTARSKQEAKVEL